MRTRRDSCNNSVGGNTETGGTALFIPIVYMELLQLSILPRERVRGYRYYPPRNYYNYLPPSRRSLPHSTTASSTGNREEKNAANLYSANIATATFAKYKQETPTISATMPTTGMAASRSAQQPNQQATVGSYRQEANMATGAAARSTTARSRTSRQPAVRFRGIDAIAQNTPKTPQEREDEKPTDEPTERENRAVGQGRRQFGGVTRPQVLSVPTGGMPSGRGVTRKSRHAFWGIMSRKRG